MHHSGYKLNTQNVRGMKFTFYAIWKLIFIAIKMVFELCLVSCFLVCLCVCQWIVYAFAAQHNTSKRYFSYIHIRTRKTHAFYINLCNLSSISVSVNIHFVCVLYKPFTTNAHTDGKIVARLIDRPTNFRNVYYFRNIVKFHIIKWGMGWVVCSTVMSTIRYVHVTYMRWWRNVNIYFALALPICVMYVQPMSMQLINIFSYAVELVIAVSVPLRIEG